MALRGMLAFSWYVVLSDGTRYRPYTLAACLQGAVDHGVTRSASSQSEGTAGKLYL